MFGGHRPCYGGREVFATEHWRDLLVFDEHFHGDNGAGLGASHQTGWTGLVALLPHLFAGLSGLSGLSGQDLLDNGLSGLLHHTRDDGRADR